MNQRIPVWLFATLLMLPCLLLSTSAKANWTPWSALGGWTNSEADCVQKQDGTLVCFVRGSDNALWHIWSTNSDHTQWSNWYSLGGSLANGSKPNCLFRDDGALVCFVQWSDNSLHHIWLPWGESWSGWAGLDGWIQNSPTCITSWANHTQCFGIGSDNALWTRRLLAGAGWEAWQYLGGHFSTGQQPECISRGPGNIECFLRGDDNSLQNIKSSDDGYSFGPFNALSVQGRLYNDPSCLSVASNHMECYVAGTDYSLHHIWWNPVSEWSGWSNLGAGSEYIVSSPDCIARNPEIRQCMVRDTNGTPFEIKWRSTTGWDAWTQLSGIIHDWFRTPECIATSPHRTDCFVIGTGRELHQTTDDAFVINLVDPFEWMGTELMAGAVFSELTDALHIQNATITKFDPYGETEMTGNISSADANDPLGIAIEHLIAMRNYLLNDSRNDVPITITANNTDGQGAFVISVRLEVMRGWVEKDNISIWGTDVKLRDVDLILLADMTGSETEYRVTGEGVIYLRPTEADGEQWLYAKPGVTRHLGNDPSTDLWIDILGRCGTTPHQDLNADANCNLDWDVFGRNVLIAEDDVSLGVILVGTTPVGGKVKFNQGTLFDVPVEGEWEGDSRPPASSRGYVKADEALLRQKILDSIGSELSTLLSMAGISDIADCCNVNAVYFECSEDVEKITADVDVLGQNLSIVYSDGDGNYDEMYAGFATGIAAALSDRYGIGYVPLLSEGLQVFSIGLDGVSDVVNWLPVSDDFFCLGIFC